MFDRLVLASNNPGKLKEFSALFAPLGITLVPQGELNVPEAEEPYFTFVENALEKARHASRLTGLPALADDSGICVEALGGAPGVLSARFAGEPKSDAANNALLVEKLANESNRRAWYTCVLVLVRHADDPQPIIADGIWMGEVVDTPQGEHGFGYDPYFWLAEHGTTVAQLDPALKNRISHRGQALAALLKKLEAFA
ncbi:RdgB/HAM1 family non-canonical purine NTP pyrophosphatase [Crenobacter sp. SG2305]|uniref:RdgB/HAM1 family non-canonical purine NTP pyrophosphatase n=1 Tax=Crenobacter oryzisoli TaxID=3056844 RepID=UPI0025AA3442|nr:RdgB/HAM1 family non-canonical purine NTP pyrophosphatase [Crenobacter sp. SG2305]MDN0084591.1 RdgB/HAM1 family non-canonical purine NTP pyrophosphatase [Crenobacter sp. SG2305]